ncbi:MAG: thioredoxin-dependent thiol peroxidase [Myxococcaceae bacterium]|nr:thioredoxin-dependent thiol peroxidase [Myxococcaceae bacterium]
MSLKAGDKAPAFSLKDASGNTVELADFKGKYVVLYFYPKDMTPGCTQEACDFRDEHAALKKAGAVVLGVSPDSAKSHLKFAEKHGLPFPLLVDEDHAVAEKYGAWGEKSLYGRKFMGIIRSTFLIGPDGRIVEAWPKVKVTGHVDEVKAALKAAKAA